MTETKPTLPTETVGTEITRLNALRHGVLSRYTVLPRENADEYRALVAALAAEHAPQGPAEEHLVEQLVGILWRKRRLRLAEAAAHRRGLDRTLASYRETVKAALVHLDATYPSERVVDAIRATATDTEEDIAEMAADEARTRRALSLLGTKRNDAYEAALAALREHTQAWWADVLARDAETNWRRTRRPPPPTPRACDACWPPRRSKSELIGLNAWFRRKKMRSSERRL
jgi:hypothetical protein